MSAPTIFITGITGCQGGAVAHEAIDQGWAVRAVARDPNSAAATALTARGVDITRGDWDDEVALAQGLAGCDCLFLNLLPSFTDAEAETRQGHRILRLARAAGVRHAIYSSLLLHPAALRPAPGTFTEPLQARLDGLLGLMDGKAALDDAVRSNAFGFPHWTVLRPGFFMANMLAPKCRFYGDFATTGTWTTALRPVDELPLVDHADIARFALAAARDPAVYHAREVQVASELRTPAAILAAVGAAAGGKALRVHHLQNDADVLEALDSNPLLVGQLINRDLGPGVDLEAIRAWGVPLTTFEDFLKRENKSAMETYASL